MQVKEIMTTSVETVSPSTPLQDVAERMKTLEIGSLPVFDGRRLVGMITDRDITVRAVSQGFGAATGTASEVMTPDPVYCFEDEDVEEAAGLMQEHRIRRLVVLNRNKQLVGIVSLGDLAVDAGDDTLVGETLEQVSEPCHPRV